MKQIPIDITDEEFNENLEHNPEIIPEHYQVFETDQKGVYKVINTFEKISYTATLEQLKNRTMLESELSNQPEFFNRCKIKNRIDSPEDLLYLDLLHREISKIFTFIDIYYLK